MSYRIVIPYNKVDTFIALCKAIETRHTELGANSPLDAGMMTAFSSRLSQAVALRKKAREMRSLAQSRFEASRQSMGLNKAQGARAEGTLYNLLCKVRDLLNIHYRENPDAVSEWGFKVVVKKVKGRTRVSYNLPVYRPNALLELAEAIWAKHSQDGAGSVLHVLDMDTFDAKLQQARTQRKEALEASAGAQSAQGQLKSLLGLSPGKNSRTPGSLFFDVLKVRDLLKILNSANPEALSLWGFRVITS